MAINNYYNPYTPYNYYGNQQQNIPYQNLPQNQSPQQWQYAQQAQQYQQQSMQQPMQQPMQQQNQQQVVHDSTIKVYPLAYVNGIEGAKTLMIPVNSLMYLKDSDSDLLFIKRVDSDGKGTIEKYRMIPVEEKEDKKENKEYALKDDLKNYATINDLKALKEEFAQEISKYTQNQKSFQNRQSNNYRKEN